MPTLTGIIDEPPQSLLSAKDHEMYADDFGAHYEVWSPSDAPGAAQTLRKMLEVDAQAHDA